MTSDTMTVGELRDAVAAAAPKFRDAMATPVAEMRAKYGDVLGADTLDNCEAELRGAVDKAIDGFKADVEAFIAGRR